MWNNLGNKRKNPGKINNVTSKVEISAMTWETAMLKKWGTVDNNNVENTMAIQGGKSL